MKKVYVIGIGGIGISAIARYYNENGYTVFGSDSTDSELIHTLQSEGINIIIGEDKNRLEEFFSPPPYQGGVRGGLVIYTEAIPNTQSELVQAKLLGLKTLTYPEALAAIANEKKLIAIAGTHGKSTTTSLTAIMMKNSDKGVNAVIGTLLKEFDGKNSHFSESEYFTIEACEYKRSFLKYTPYIGIITNIEIDHLDYYKDLDDYISAYKEFIDNIKTGGSVILNGEDENCKKLLNLRYDISYIELYKNYYTYSGQIIELPKIELQVPGDHILYDSHISYIVGQLVGLNNIDIIKSLESYTGVWRRMEIIGQTLHGNTLMSDYGHHPTEIKLTLRAIKEKYPDKELYTIFQPHQYNRTIELLEGFQDSFIDTDRLVIPNIYESRDSKEDKENMSTQKLVDKIKGDNIQNGHGLQQTEKLIQDYDSQNPGQAIILLLGAGDVDNLRYKIKTT